MIGGQETTVHADVRDSTDAEYWDGIAGEWQHEGEGRAWRMVSDAVNVRLLERWLPRNPRGSVLKTDLFDEVAGEGLLSWLSASFASVSGVDISPAVVSSIRDRYDGVTAEVADVRRLPFANGQFDCVFSNSTLDHLPTRQAIAEAVRELHRVTRSGGHLLITLDNPVNPIVGLRYKLPAVLRDGVVPYALGATLGPRALRTVLQESGFEVLKTGAVFHSPRVLVVAAGRLVDRRPASVRQRYARLWQPFELLGALPTRYLTGHFVAALARKALGRSHLTNTAAIAGHELTAGPVRPEDL